MLGGAACAVASIPALGKPVRSLLGSRDVSDGGSFTAKDYVQDGLVAMWDGIENAGWGVHDASATMWKDLVGEHNVALGGGMSFASNALVCTAQGIATGTSISESIAAIEFVEFHSVRQDGMPFQLKSSRQCVLRNTYDTYSFSQNATDSSMPYQFGSIHAVYVALASDGTIDTCYIDGVDVTSQKRARDANIGFYGGVRIGGATASYFSYYGSLYALRVRSSTLTSAEIAINYAVDKLRFNLP